MNGEPTFIWRSYPWAVPSFAGTPPSRSFVRWSSSLLSYCLAPMAAYSEERVIVYHNRPAGYVMVLVQVLLPTAGISQTASTMPSRIA